MHAGVNVTFKDIELSDRVRIGSMTDETTKELAHSARRLRLETLIGLRWLAVAGQTGALLVTHFGLGFSVPLATALTTVLVSGILNLALRWRYAQNTRLGDGAAAMLLVYDIVQLSVLLYLTGGLQNPFAILLVAPVTISAVSLPAIYTIGILGIMIAGGTLLAMLHLPLPWYPDQVLEMPILYVFGVWIALVLGAGFVAIYASRIAREARLLADALNATELALAREQHLTQLDGLAAAAAHELGTPLATITLVVKELASQLPPDGTLREDVNLLAQEVKRCRDILGKLKSLDAGPGGAWDRLRISHLLAEVADPARDFGVSLTIDHAGIGPEPVCRRNPGVIYGLGNLIENAVDFAKTEVQIRARWDESRLILEIQDDGPGFSPDVQGRLGEPYVTTRAHRRAKTDQAPGLGLGLFVAKTLLERSGATMTMGNRPTPATGAIIRIEWRRDDIEIAADETGYSAEPQE